MFFFFVQAVCTLTSALFCDTTQQIVVIPYRCLGTTYSFHLQESRNPRIRLSRNVGKELQPYAAWYPRRAPISSKSRRKPETTWHVLCFTYVEYFFNSQSFTAASYKQQPFAMDTQEEKSQLTISNAEAPCSTAVKMERHHPTITRSFYILCAEINAVTYAMR